MFDIRQQHLTTSDLLTLMDSRFGDFFPEVWLRTNSQAATGRISNRIAVPIPLQLMHAIEWEPGHRLRMAPAPLSIWPHLGHILATSWPLLSTGSSFHDRGRIH